MYSVYVSVSVHDVMYKINVLTENGTVIQSLALQSILSVRQDRVYFAYMYKLIKDNIIMNTE